MDPTAGRVLSSELIIHRAFRTLFILNPSIILVPVTTMMCGDILSVCSKNLLYAVQGVK